MRWGERLEFVAERARRLHLHPPYVPHQEINANDDEPLSCVLVRSGQAVVVNLDLPNVRGKSRGRALGRRPSPAARQLRANRATLAECMPRQERSLSSRRLGERKRVFSQFGPQAARRCAWPGTARSLVFQTMLRGQAVKFGLSIRAMNCSAARLRYRLLRPQRQQHFRQRLLRPQLQQRFRHRLLRAPPPMPAFAAGAVNAKPRTTAPLASAQANLPFLCG